MIIKDTPFKVTERIALVVKDSKEADIFTYGMVTNGLKNITSFYSANEAYEVVIRQQFSLFVTRVEMKDMNGLILIQKMRETGNYGTENHLVVCDSIDPASLSIFFEYDLPYVIVSPFKKENIIEKIKFMVEKENSLPPEEQLYRDARAAFNNNLLDMAEDMLKSVLKMNANSERAIILMGDVFMKRGKLDQAEEQFEKAIQINPKSFVASSKLAGCFLSKGLFQKSTPLFNSLFEINKYNVKMLEKAGLSNIQSDDLDNAQKNINQLTKVDEKNPTASTLQVDVKIKKGEYDGLSQILSKTHSEAEVVKILNSAGVKLAKEKDPQSAIRMYKSCINEASANHYLYAVFYNMGLAYKMLNSKEEAKEAFEKSISLKPDFEKAKTAIQNLG